MTNKTLIQINDKEYNVYDNRVLLYVIKQEYGLTPNGNGLSGRWVIRDTLGTFLDFDQYRNDLFEKYNIAC
jgi:hypothetical protein